MSTGALRVIVTRASPASYTRSGGAAVPAACPEATHWSSPAEHVHFILEQHLTETRPRTTPPPGRRAPPS